MTTSTTAQHHDPLDAAVRLAPAIREAAPEIDAARQLPPEIVKAMRDAGLFHTNVPAVYGGGQCDPVTTCRVIETVAAADGSAGWCLMIAAQNATIAGFVEPSFAARIWGNGGIAAGSARPIGRAEAEGDGYRVNGRWPFASGSSHATWFAGESVLYHDGEPVRDEAGNPRSAFAVLPRDEVTTLLARIAPVASRAGGIAVVPTAPGPAYSFAPSLLEPDAAVPGAAALAATG